MAPKHDLKPPEAHDVIEKRGTKASQEHGSAPHRPRCETMEEDFVGPVAWNFVAQGLDCSWLEAHTFYVCAVGHPKTTPVSGIESRDRHVWNLLLDHLGVEHLAERVGRGLESLVNRLTLGVVHEEVHVDLGRPAVRPLEPDMQL